MIQSMRNTSLIPVVILLTTGIGISLLRLLSDCQRDVRPPAGLTRMAFIGRFHALKWEIFLAFEQYTPTPLESVINFEH